MQRKSSRQHAKSDLGDPEFSNDTFPDTFQEYLELVRSSAEFQRNIRKVEKQLNNLAEEGERLKSRMDIRDIVFGPIPKTALKRPVRPSYMLLSVDEGLKADLLLDTCCEGNGELIIEKNNIEISRDKASCLHPRQWLNDEVINFYMHLIHDKYPKSYIWNSFFWLKVSGDGKGYNYKSVQRWTSRKKIDGCIPTFQ